jgi:hypothetical protein
LNEASVVFKRDPASKTQIPETASDRPPMTLSVNIRQAGPKAEAPSSLEKSSIRKLALACMTASSDPDLKRELAETTSKANPASARSNIPRICGPDALLSLMASSV